MIVVVLLLFLALAPGCSSTKSPPENNASANAANSAAAPAVSVQTAKVEVRELQRSVQAVGSLDLCLPLTLLFTPVAYSIFDDIVARFRTKPHEA